MSRIYTLCIYDEKDILIKACCTYNSMERCKKLLEDNFKDADERCNKLDDIFSVFGYSESI